MPADSVNQFERAYRAWPLLIARAAMKSTITYAELAHLLHMHPRPIRFVLGVVQDWCLREKKPPLTILVVNQHHHQPGHGFIAWDVNDLAEGYRQVHSFRWSDLSNPFAFASDGSTLQQLADRLVSKPEEADVIYARIQNRGFAQIVFRLVLLAAYRGRCAFCGLSLTDALQAAHIVPWRKASNEERVLPSNGLLLCSTHHALFDAGILTVSPDLTIGCRQQQLPGHRWNDADQRAAIAYHGQPVTLPADARLRPSEAALAYRAGQPSS